MFGNAPSTQSYQSPDLRGLEVADASITVRFRILYRIWKYVRPGGRQHRDSDEFFPRRFFCTNYRNDRLGSERVGQLHGSFTPDHNHGFFFLKQGREMCSALLGVVDSVVKADYASKRCTKVNIVVHGKSRGHFRRFVALSCRDKGHVV